MLFRRAEIKRAIFLYKRLPINGADVSGGSINISLLDIFPAQKHEEAAKKGRDY